MFKFGRALLIALLLTAGTAFAQGLGIGSGADDLPILGGKGGSPAVNSVLGVTAGQCLGTAGTNCLGVQ